MSRHIIRTPIPPAVEPDFMLRRRVAHAANVEVRAAASRFGREDSRYQAAVERRAAASQFVELLTKASHI
jgi:hypothetical protein